MTRRLDRGLLAGAALFGAGWGLAGVCPGPALADLVTGAPAFLVFFVAMAGGAVAGTRLEEGWRAAPAEMPAPPPAPQPPAGRPEATCG